MSGKGRMTAGTLLSLAVSLPLLVPILQPGWPTGHDLLHPLRLFEQDLMIRAGHFPVRWYPDVSAGFGSAHPLYYAPLFYLVAQLFSFAGLPLDLGLKLALAGVLLVTSWAMYRLVSRWLGPGAGLVAAAAVTYVPYHLADLYVRAAFSELTVFATLPLTLIAFERLGPTPDRRGILLASLAFAALLLSHTITTMIAPALLVFWVALLSFDREYRAPVVYRSVGSAAMLGFGLAAFFLIPLALERGHIDVREYSAGYFSWDRHFVSPLQLLWSPWGFGLSVPGPGDGFSFRLGGLHILGSLMALFVWLRIHRTARTFRPAVWLAVAFILAGVLLTLPVSRPLWEHLGPLQLFQFPWRFLLFPALGMAILFGLVAFYAEGGRSADGNHPAVGIPSPIAGMITLVLVVSGLPLLKVAGRVPPAAAHFLRDTTLADARLAADSGAQLSRRFVKATTARWFDHLPYGATPRPTRADASRPYFEVLSGTAAVEIMDTGPVRYRAGVTASDTATIRLNVYRDPGWTLRLDGQPIRPVPAKGRPAHLLRVPPGRHELAAVLTRTRPRLLGDAISLLTLGVVGVLGLLPVKVGRA